MDSALCAFARFIDTCLLLPLMLCLEATSERRCVSSALQP